MATPQAQGDWIVIGISGVTCGGKTTLASRLSSLLVPVYVFHQDPYFYPDDSPKHVRCDGLDHNNYDILGALDMDAFYRDVISTMAGDDKSHESTVERAPGKTEVPGKRFLILEGFTVLNYRPLYDLCTLRYYLTLPYGVCAERRAHRLYDPPDVAGYFESCVWPEHCRYKAQLESDPAVRFVVGEEDVCALVMKEIAELGGTGVH